MSKQLNEFYDQFVSKSHDDYLGFLNCGYWKGVQNSLELAQINLIETLAGFFVRRGGNVLDVGCGRGTSSKFLTKYFDAKNVTGIDAADSHIKICKLIAPNSDFKLMDATNLQFEDASFDNVLCMDAAYHFVTRQNFLEEAYRVLRSGGRLAMSDFVVRDDERHRLWSSETEWPNEAFPAENCMSNLDVYRDNLLSIGFKYVRIENANEFRGIPCRQFFIARAEREEDHAKLESLVRHQPFGTHCMVYAIKY